jgi:hypothetical protein
VELLGEFSRQGGLAAAHEADDYDLLFAHDVSPDSVLVSVLPA